MNYPTDEQFLELFGVTGVERVFRLSNYFRAQNPDGAAGLLKQCSAWSTSYRVFEDPAHIDRFRERVGFRQDLRFFDPKEDLLESMSDKLLLLSDLGDDLPTWAILYLISRPLKGGIRSLIEEYQSGRSLNAAQLLKHLTELAERRESAERFE